ncbi:protein gravitropic in the light 1 [Tanacetum coccineum]
MQTKIELTLEQSPSQGVSNDFLVKRIENEAKNAQLVTPPPLKQEVPSSILGWQVRGTVASVRGTVAGGGWTNKKVTRGTGVSYALSWKPCQGDSLNLPDHRAQVDQESQIKMIQVKEMMQDNDLKNSKSKDKGSRSRSQSMNEQSHYKQDKTKTRQSINVKSHIFNVIGSTEEFEERDLNIGGDCGFFNVTVLVMESMLNKLQYDIDGKDDKVAMLRKELGEIEEVNRKLSVKLSKILKPPNGFLPTVRVFDSMLRDACRCSHRFTNVLIQF